MATIAWADARDRLRQALAVALDGDPSVLGVGLVGSFGRGEADEWSDLDLLVVVGDDDVATWTAHNDVWAAAALVVPAPQNTRSTASSAGSLHVADAWPVGVDWYVYPCAEASWPVDCAMLFGADRVERTDRWFDDWNALGPRGTSHGFSDDELTMARLAMARLAMVPITEKQIARGQTSLAELGALEAFVREAAPAHLVDPLLRHLADVRRRRSCRTAGATSSPGPVDVCDGTDAVGANDMDTGRHHIARAAGSPMSAAPRPPRSRSARRGDGSPATSPRGTRARRRRPPATAPAAATSRRCRVPAPTVAPPAGCGTSTARGVRRLEELHHLEHPRPLAGGDPRLQAPRGQPRYRAGPRARRRSGLGSSRWRRAR